MYLFLATREFIPPAVLREKVGLWIKQAHDNEQFRKELVDHMFATKSLCRKYYHEIVLDGSLIGIREYKLLSLIYNVKIVVLEQQEIVLLEGLSDIKILSNDQLNELRRQPKVVVLKLRI